MIGQKSILEKFNTFENIPSAVLLIGRKGCGKKTLVNTISNNLGVEIINIDKFSDDVKLELNIAVGRKLLIVDLTTLAQEKQSTSLQNSALKFIEDIPATYKIFILAEDESSVLDTILNRCYIQTFEEYTVDELRAIAAENNNSILEAYEDKYFNYLTTPQEVLTAPNVKQIQEIETLIDTIFNAIARANISNTLSISKKINFDNEIGLYDLNIFLNIFRYKLVEKLKTDYDEKYFQVFNKFNILYYNINRGNNNKMSMFENFLLDVKQILT